MGGGREREREAEEGEKLWHEGKRGQERGVEEGNEGAKRKEQR